MPLALAASRHDAVIELAPRDATQPRVLVEADPMVTVLTSVMEAFGPLADRLPAVLRKQARSAAWRTPVPMLVRLLSGTAALTCPDFLTGQGKPATFTEQVEQLRSLPPEVLEQDLNAHPDHRWWQEDPDRVLARYCAAITTYRRDVVDPLYPDWERRLQREQMRLTVGLAEYGEDFILGVLHPQLRVESGRLHLRTHHVSGLALWRPRVVVLKPMVATAATYFTNIGRADNPRVNTAFFAAAPPVLRPGWPNQAEDGAGVDLLIGRPRAEILRSLRRRPGTTTDLADELRLAPSSVSYHLKTLRRAGAVSPSRRRGSVYYLLTDRGRRVLCV